MSSYDCKRSCCSDPNCNGYSIDESNDGCYLSKCDSCILSCSTCKFARKLVPTSTVICPPETTTSDDSATTTPGAETSSEPATTADRGMSTTVSTDVNGVDGHTSSASTDHISTSSDPTTADVDKSTTVFTSSTSQDYISTWITVDSQPTNPSPIYSQSTKPLPVYSTSASTQMTGNVTCVCVCEDANITLQESIDKRKKELVMNKKELSFYIRKLTSAEDSRVSSRNIGVIGILVMTVFGLLLFCTDIFLVLRYFCEKISKRHHV